MTWPRVDHNADTGFLCNRHRISRHRISDFFSATLSLANILHNARWTAADNWEIRKCKFSAISPPQLRNLGFVHIFEGWQNPSESDGAYLSLSVLKITKSGNNLFTSVNQRSPHCLEEWWPGGISGPKRVQEMTQNCAQEKLAENFINLISAIQFLPVLLFVFVWFIWVQFKTKSNAREIWRSWSRNSFSQHSLIMRCHGIGWSSQMGTPDAALKPHLLTQIKMLL